MTEPDPQELELMRGGRIFVAGHRGMVGSALVRRLRAAGCNNLLLKSRAELDLTEQAAVRSFFASAKPDYVFLAAARVGGIKANDTYPADFIYDNLMIAANIIHAANANDTRRLLFLGSSCIYPKLAPQPMTEECLLKGSLEPTNEPYAIAKIAGIKLCESYNRQYGTDFRSIMPTNLYGPEDNFDLQTSHVLPALIRKFHEAKEGRHDHVNVWGTGAPRREFLHVDDLADACLYVISLPQRKYEAATKTMLSHLNVGTGSDVTIKNLAELVSRAVGFNGEIRFDPQYPDGTPRKLLDVSAIEKLGWRARITLADGIISTYAWYRENGAQANRGRDAHQ